jgi:DNA polymerase-4
MPLVLCRDCSTLIERVGASLEALARCGLCGTARVVVHEELDTLDIAHIDCDAFYASVEKRDDPSLADKPLIVGHPGGRGVVTTACYIARSYGPRSAMPMFKALQMCPDAVVIAPNMAKYKAVSAEIRAVFADISSCIEPLSLDEAYLDLTEAHRRSGELPALALAAAQRRIESEIGITVSIGLSYNKFLAKLASELQKPRGFSVVGRAEARDFVAGMPVGKIHGVGSATAERMRAEGFELVSDLQALGEREMIARFGRFGARLHQFAHGEDTRRVTPDRPTKSVSAEDTFRSDIAHLPQLLDQLRPLCEQVERRLKRADLAGRTVVLKLKTADFQIITRNRQLAQPTQRAPVLFETAERILPTVADGRRAFRLIGIGVGDVVPAVEADPPDLFSV